MISGKIFDKRVNNADNCNLKTNGWTYYPVIFTVHRLITALHRLLIYQGL